ncbi:hypothetical protein [Microbacterium gorillae]|uniref:hypothetical protein n=1 Tax=Microbacterium gorillae TaxID=1231063 RepID=UPI000590359B|nr:hypothetical protein [Microbacterium gorillae]
MTSPAYPLHWPDAVTDTYDAVLAESPTLSGASHSSLVEACELLTAAYALQAVAAGAGYVATGSTGQAVVHPATVESRLSREAAARILARLIAPTTVGQKLARQRHGGATR